MKVSPELRFGSFVPNSIKNFKKTIDIIEKAWYDIDEERDQKEKIKKRKEESPMICRQLSFREVRFANI